MSRTHYLFESMMLLSAVLATMAVIGSRWAAGV